jgi:hypothetical protein
VGPELGELPGLVEHRVPPRVVTLRSCLSGSARRQDPGSSGGAANELSDCGDGRGGSWGWDSVPEAVPEVNASTTGGANAATSARVAAVDGPASSSGPAAGAPSSPPQVAVNDNTIEEPRREPKFILEHYPVGAPGDVSLFDAMGTTHFTLN